MTDLEEKAVLELKQLISKIENGEFKITEAGLWNKLEYSNVSNDKGPIQVWETKYIIRHYKTE